MTGLGQSLLHLNRQLLLESLGEERLAQKKAQEFVR